MTSISAITSVSPIATATSGMSAAERRFQQSAERMASLGTERDPAKAVDPLAETLAQAQARQTFDANAAVLRVSGSMMKRVLDIAV